MGWNFYKIDTLPEPGDLVWCKWPYREQSGQPGPVARPVLVRSAILHEDPETDTQFGSVVVFYGTGEFTAAHFATDLVIADMARARQLGLHKPTRFALDLANQKNLIWCEEFFVANDYVRAQGLQIGRLSDAELDRVRERLARRG